MLSLITGGPRAPRYGQTPTSDDLYLFNSTPPGASYRFAPLLRASHRSYTPPGMGAVRDDSFILAWYDDRTTSLYAARLCLPP